MSCFKFLCLSLILEVCFCVESYNGEWAYLFTDEEREIIASKPIRREIRELSTEEWDKFVAAMWTMKLTPQAKGEQLYGSKYTSYDQILCQHLETDTLAGNIAHQQPAFFTYHRAIELRFEQSIQAIDDSIDAIPFWDFRLDAVEPSNSIIFSDAYLGSVPGNIDEDYMVTDGKFARWPISSNRDYDICPGLISTSPYGYLRTQWLVQDHPYTVRYGNITCTSHESYTQAVLDWETCLEEVGIGPFHDCMNTNVHSCAHSNIGGLGYQFDGQTVDNGCSAYYDFIDNHKLCMKCPECEYGQDETMDCWCELDYSIPGCTQYDASNYSIANSKVPGDFRDLASSPNEPMFIFHHINLDRYFYTWQIMNANYSDIYWGFPTSGGYYGINLNETCSWEYPFMNLWDNDSRAYTNRDILDKSTVLLATYTYQSIIDMITPPVENEVDDIDAVVIDGSDYLGSVSVTLWYAIACLSMVAMICSVSVALYACRRRYDNTVPKQPTQKATLYYTF